MKIVHGLAVLMTFAALLSLGCQRIKGPYETRMENLMKSPRYNSLTPQDKEEWIGKARRADEISTKSSQTQQETIDLSSIRRMLDFEESLGPSDFRWELPANDRR